MLLSACDVPCHVPFQAFLTQSWRAISGPLDLLLHLKSQLAASGLLEHQNSLITFSLRRYKVVSRAPSSPGGPVILVL